MYRKVYSRENQEEWEEKANAGFKEFCSSSWKYDWEGEDRWSPYDSPHVYISYGYRVSCVLTAENLEKVSEYFHLQLANHPFLDAEEFFSILAEDLDMQIEKAFADSGEILDDYYPPSGEEFYYKDIFDNFCQSHGFRLEDFEENGYASDCYEHD